MSLQDPIADMLTRLRNGATAELTSVAMPSSKMKANIAQVLKEEGYIVGYNVEDAQVGQTLTIELKYYREKAVMEGLKRVSKPSCRIYSASSEIPKVRNGLGTAVLSTPNGVISDRKARKGNVGGEVLFYVW